MALTAAQQAEINRKAAAGIPLSNPSSAVQAIYNQAVAANQKQKSFESQQLQAQEIKRKAEAGIPLTNASAASKVMYAEFQKSAGSQPTAIQTASNTVQQLITPVNTTKAAPQGATKSVRETEMQKFTGWDNDPAVRQLQEQSWGVYVDTGKWNTADQKELHDQAEKARSYNNPMYDGSKYGPLDWMDAEKITPRTTTPGANTIEGGIDAILDPSKFGGYAQAGIGIIFIFFIFSMFRR